MTTAQLFAAHSAGPDEDVLDDFGDDLDLDDFGDDDDLDDFGDDDDLDDFGDDDDDFGDDLDLDDFGEDLDLDLFGKGTTRRHKKRCVRRLERLKKSCPNMGVFQGEALLVDDFGLEDEVDDYGNVEDYLGLDPDEFAADMEIDEAEAYGVVLAALSVWIASYITAPALVATATAAGGIGLGALLSKMGAKSKYVRQAARLVKLCLGGKTDGKRWRRNEKWLNRNWRRLQRRGKTGGLQPPARVISQARNCKSGPVYQKAVSARKAASRGQVATPHAVRQDIHKRRNRIWRGRHQRAQLPSYQRRRLGPNIAPAGRGSGPRRGIRPHQMSQIRHDASRTNFARRHPGRAAPGGRGPGGGGRGPGGGGRGPGGGGRGAGGGHSPSGGGGRGQGRGHTSGGFPRTDSPGGRAQTSDRPSRGGGGGGRSAPSVPDTGLQVMTRPADYGATQVLTEGGTWVPDVSTCLAGHPLTAVLGSAAIFGLGVALSTTVKDRLGYGASYNWHDGGAGSFGIRD